MASGKIGLVGVLVQFRVEEECKIEPENAMSLNMTGKGAVTIHGKPKRVTNSLVQVMCGCSG